MPDFNDEGNQGQEIVVHADTLNAKTWIGLPPDSSLILLGVDVLGPKHLNNIESAASFKCECTVMLADCFPDNLCTKLELPLLQSVSERPFAWSSLTDVALHAIARLPSFSFFSCRNLKRLYLPNLLVGGDSCFRNCTVLDTLNITKAQSMGAFAFSGCNMLINVDMPELVHAGQACFLGCEMLANVCLPKLCFVANQMFEGCTRLAYLCLLVATLIEEDACVRCTNLKEIVGPKVHTIRAAAFMGCSFLNKAGIPLVRHIGEFAFYGCAFKSVVLHRLVYVGRSAFGKNAQLSRISLPLLQIVARAAFSKNVLLHSVCLPRLKTLEYNAFSGCAFLNEKNCRFSDTVQFIAKYAFRDTNFSNVFTPARCHVHEHAFGKEMLVPETAPKNIMEHRYFFRKSIATRMLLPEQRVYLKTYFCTVARLMKKGAFDMCPLEMYLLCLSFVEFEAMLQ